jgi:hypothetical protein
MTFDTLGGGLGVPRRGRPSTSLLGRLPDLTAEQRRLELPVGAQVTRFFSCVMLLAEIRDYLNPRAGSRGLFLFALGKVESGCRERSGSPAAAI